MKVKFKDDYAISRKLGSGSFGVVYECRSIATQEIYAAKVMKKRKGGEKEDRRQQQQQKDASADEFEREIRIPLSLGDCAAPYLVKLIAVYPEEQIIVMEKAETDLRTYIETPGNTPLSETAVASLCRVLCMGLDTFHDRGLMHRDLKPANILLRDATNLETAVLADFGSSRQLDKDTMAATYAPGTPIYSAPEMINFPTEAVAYNHQVDMWSMGIIAFEMLVGEIPFQSTSLLRLFAEIQNPSAFLEAAERRHTRWAAASASFRDFVTRLLDVDPVRRLSARRSLHHPFISRDQPIEATGTIDLLPCGQDDAITASIIVPPSQLWFGTAAGVVGALPLNPTPMSAAGGGIVPSQSTGERICSMVHNDASPGEVWTSGISTSGIATVRVWRVLCPGSMGIGYLSLGSSQDDAYVRDGHVHWGEGSKRKCVPLSKVALPGPHSYSGGSGGGGGGPSKNYGAFFWKTKKKKDVRGGGGSAPSISLCYSASSVPSASSSSVPFVRPRSIGGGAYSASSSASPSSNGSGSVGGGDAVTVMTFRNEHEAREWRSLFARVRELEAADEGAVICCAVSPPPLPSERSLPPPRLTVLDAGRVVSVRDSTVLLEAWTIAPTGAHNEVHPRCIDKQTLGTLRPASAGHARGGSYVNWPIMRVSPTVLAVALPRQIVLFPISSVGERHRRSSSSPPTAGDDGSGDNKRYSPSPALLMEPSSSFDRLLPPKQPLSNEEEGKEGGRLSHKVIRLEWEVRCAIALPTRREIWIGHDIEHGICVHPLQQRPLRKHRNGEGGGDRDTAASLPIRIDVSALAALGFESGDAHRPVTALAVSPAGDGLVWGTLRTGYLFSVDIVRREIVSTVSIGEKVEYGIYSTVLQPYVSHLGFPQLLVSANPRRIVWWTSRAENIRRRRDSSVPLLAIGATGAPVASLTPRSEATVVREDEEEFVRWEGDSVRG